MSYQRYDHLNPPVVRLYPDSRMLLGRLGGGAPPLPEYGYDRFGTQPQSQSQTQPSQSAGYPANSQSGQPFTQQSGQYNTQGPNSSLSQDSFAFESQGTADMGGHPFVSPLSQDTS